MKEIASHLASGDEVQRRAARRRLNDYSRDEITEFLEREWTDLERQRRQRKQLLWRIRLVALSISLTVLLISLCFWHQLNHFLGRETASVIRLCTVPAVNLLILLAEAVLSIDGQRRAGLRTILIEYADVRHVPALIDALVDGGDRRQIEGNIALSLPEYHRHDLPPLDDTQRKRLLAELNDAPERIKARKEAWLTDEDVAYLSALLGYWEQESHALAPLPKKAMKVITGLTHPLKRADETTRDRWRRVQETADDCLLRLQKAHPS